MSDAIVVNGLATLPYPPGTTAGTWRPEHFIDAMRSGNVRAANLTVAVDEGFEEAALSVMRALRTYDGVGDSRVARSVDDVRAAADAGGTALILGFQNSNAVEGSLEKLEFFHGLGVRIIQLTYQRRNLSADGCGEPSDAGLSRFGFRLVQRMNELGVLIDLSHTGRRSSLEAIEASSVPVVFSHANVAQLAPHPRNKSDDEIRLLAERGGVIGITAIARFLAPDTGRASVDDLLDHVDYVAQLVGPRHVGLGLDITEGLSRDVFDREKRPLLDTYPELEGELSLDEYYAAPLRGMADVGVIGERLSARGYSATEVIDILGGNFVRVFGATWHAATPRDNPTVKSLPTTMVAS